MIHRTGTVNASSLSPPLYLVLMKLLSLPSLDQPNYRPGRFHAHVLPSASTSLPTNPFLSSLHDSPTSSAQRGHQVVPSGITGATTSTDPLTRKNSKRERLKHVGGGAKRFFQRNKKGKEGEEANERHPRIRADERERLLDPTIRAPRRLFDDSRNPITSKTGPRLLASNGGGARGIVREEEEGRDDDEDEEDDSSEISWLLLRPGKKRVKRWMSSWWKRWALLVLLPCCIVSCCSSSSPSRFRLRRSNRLGAHYPQRRNDRSGYGVVYRSQCRIRTTKNLHGVSFSLGISAFRGKPDKLIIAVWMQIYRGLRQVIHLEASNRCYGSCPGTTNEARAQLHSSNRYLHDKS